MAVGTEVCPIDAVETDGEILQKCCSPEPKRRSGLYGKIIKAPRSRIINAPRSRISSTRTEGARYAYDVSIPSTVRAFQVRWECPDLNLILADNMNYVVGFFG